MEYARSIAKGEDLPCKDKISLKTKEEAEGAAATAKYRYGEKPKVYLCKHCQSWHLTRNYEDEK